MTSNFFHPSSGHLEASALSTEHHQLTWALSRGRMGRRMSRRRTMMRSAPPICFYWAEHSQLHFRTPISGRLGIHTGDNLGMMLWKVIWFWRGVAGRKPCFKLCYSSGWLYDIYVYECISETITSSIRNISCLVLVKPWMLVHQMNKNFLTIHLKKHIYVPYIYTE